MCRRVRWIRAHFVFWSLLTVFSLPALGQGVAGGSLGGYGSASPSSTMAMSGGTVIPYNGVYGGFMPYRMGGSGSLSFRSFGGRTSEAKLPSFRLSQTAGGMDSVSKMGAPGTLLGGTGISGSDTQEMKGMSNRPRRGKAGVMPPSFGYPFRQPPRLTEPGSSSIGMSM